MGAIHLVLKRLAAEVVGAALSGVASFARQLGSYLGAVVRITPLSAAIALCFAAAGAAASFHLGERLPAEILTQDAWFEADVERVFDNMSYRLSDNHRTNVHPLFPIAAHPPTLALSLLGVSEQRAVDLLMAGAAGLWLGLFFLLVRAAGAPRYAAAAFTLLAGASAASIFWTTVPETYVFGALSMLPALAIAARADDAKPPLAVTMLASAASMSMTVSNWTAGIAAAFAIHRPGQAARATLDAFILVSAIWVVQKLAYPSAAFFLEFGEELSYASVGEDPLGGGVIQRLTVLVFHGLIAPTAALAETPGGAPFVSFQSAALWSHAPPGLAAAVLWVVMLGLGVAALAGPGPREAYRLTLLGTVVTQVALHLVYGYESFLYSLHVTPLLVLLAACAAPRRPRLLSALAVLLAVIAAAINTQSFLDAGRLLASLS